jgi:hypothetical protein
VTIHVTVETKEILFDGSRIHTNKAGATFELHKTSLQDTELIADTIAEKKLCEISVARTG